MDPLKAASISSRHAGTEAERLLQALDAMNDGFALKRANLQRQYPDETQAQIDARLHTWMARG